LDYFERAEEESHLQALKEARAAREAGHNLRVYNGGKGLKVVLADEKDDEDYGRNENNDEMLNFYEEGDVLDDEYFWNVFSFSLYTWIKNRSSSRKKKLMLISLSVSDDCMTKFRANNPQAGKNMTKLRIMVTLRTALMDHLLY